MYRSNVTIREDAGTSLDDPVLRCTSDVHSNTWTVAAAYWIWLYGQVRV
jgi:hypothetical protein